ncbi:MAG: YidC/Oxa1 family membrane protein insertase, partial [Clostridia bacterium]|nr:YidC/Oxa1 family membrane protein insertase [Clostridia bacterium]
NYSPLSALNGSVSLLLEIPFFMAAYQFLSNLDILNGVSFGPIADLSQPDGLIRLGALSINFLPILMTLINVVSSTLYLKGFPLKMKIQLYGMALLFLVLLYDSPAGLVFYWTLNNTYSLGKTLVNRIPHGGKILSGLLFLGGAVLAVLRKTLLGGMHRRLVLMLGLLMMLPLAFILVKRFLPKREEKKMPKASTGMFVCGALFLTVLTGVLIPSTFIAASPLEYVDVTYFYHPVWYVVRSACMAAGTFMVWMSVFYWLMSPKAKVIFSRLVWILCGVMLVNYMFFGTDLGILSSALKYENDMRFGRTEILLNFAVILVLAVLMGLIHIRLSRSVGAVLLTGVLVLGGMSGINTVKIMRAVQPVAEQAEIVSAQNPEITFSKDGENVAVIMIDRMMGLYLPYLVNEKPELLEQFDGFTFYPNTLSYGGTTNFASPALFGGYEYTPVELNRRDTESLALKQNEALKIMPILFSENGYDVTIFDPPYANYQWIPDLSIYDEYPEFKTCNTIGFYTALENKATAIENNKRNFFCFSIMKTMPVYFQTIIYDGGKYRQVASSEDTSIVQTAYDASTADGIEELFLESYNTLVKLPEITKVTEESDKNFLLMSNKTTHEVTLL